MNMIFAFIWTFGANIYDKYRAKFNEFIKFKFSNFYQ